MRSILRSRLNPSYLTMASGSVLVMGMLLAVLLFSTSDRGQTRFGIPLGADFAGFYVAAQILDHGQADQLYDRALHDRLYHELLPGEEERASIPYVHPPFVAGTLRLFSRYPYPVAFGIWLFLAAGLFVAAWRFLLGAIPWPESRQQWLIIQLAASFEPFLFECWLGGQLSVLAFVSFAIFFVAMQRSQPVLAGMALGLSFYKPTLLILVLPMLVIGRRWHILLGMTITGLLLAGLSILLVGWHVSFGYVNVLLNFSRSTAGGDLEIRTWKYVDLNNCLRLIFGHGSVAQRLMLIAIGLIPFGLLSRIWWSYERLDLDLRPMLWATTISWVPLLNLYFGIYDSILILQSLVITSAWICRRSTVAHPLAQSGLSELILALAIVPWFSQNLAAQSGFPLYSLLIMLLGSIQLYWIYRALPELWPFSRRSA